MSAYPTTADPARIDSAGMDTASGSPLQQGNLVLESIARQEAMRALLAFSELHEQIRNRRTATGREADRDLFETERFILDEVLQLICDRVQAITHADAVVVALAEKSEATRSADDRESRAANPQLLCRAAAGSLAVTRGVHLIGESEFLQEGLDTGRILRCDDGEIDTRVELDFAHALGARSTVLVPLRGRREQLGVLQAFSRAPWAFTDQDVRSFDLFAELVLAALKPEDEDRRIHWLSDVADEVLQAKPVTAPVAEVSAQVAALAESEIAAIEPAIIPEATLASSPISTTRTFFHGSLAAPPSALPEPALIPAVADDSPQTSNWRMASESPLDDTAPDVTSDFTSPMVPDIAADPYAGIVDEAQLKPRIRVFCLAFLSPEGIFPA